MGKRARGGMLLKGFASHFTLFLFTDQGVHEQALKPVDNCTKALTPWPLGTCHLCGASLLRGGPPPARARGATETGRAM